MAEAGRALPNQAQLFGADFEGDNSTNSHADLFGGTWGSESSAFPGLFFTSFDEQNPLPPFGLDEDLDMAGLGNDDQRPPQY